MNFWCAFLAGILGIASTSPVVAGGARQADWVIREGGLWVAGKRVFLKTAKPLRNFADPAACDQLAAELPRLKAKGFNALSLNCYWHHFDGDGDGRLDGPLDRLAALIHAIHDAGMFPCLSVETYGVGGGQIPADFWKRYPEAVAINAEGAPVRDTEYGFKTAVPSLFHADYRSTVQDYIRALTAALPHKLVLYYETTVEPQFMGQQDLDYSPHARRAYEAWLARNKLTTPAWPAAFPVPTSFRESEEWLRFRAESLADWVNEDAAVFRAVAGGDAYIAVDYLETCGREMRLRNGDSETFLRSLSCADILQVNWHWRSHEHRANECAYTHVREVMRATGRRWAITEHMTLNGTDFRPDEVPAILRNALSHGTKFGWEFVNVGASTRDPFCLYHDDWSPKDVMRPVDENWAQWQAEIEAAMSE